MKLLKVFVSFSFFLLFIWSCSLTNQNSSTAIVWEEYLNAPVTAGVVMDSGLNYLFFGDTNGTVFSYFPSTGTMRWKNSWPGETVTGIYADYTSVYTVSTGSGQTFFRKYNLSGDLITNATANFTVKDSILYDSGQLVVHGGSFIGAFSLSDPYTVHSFTLSGNNSISKVLRDGTYYYAISTNADIYRVDTNILNGVGSLYDSYPNSGTSLFTGSALIYNGYLYIGTSDGVDKYNTSSLTSVSQVIGSRSVRAAMMKDPLTTALYVSFSDYLTPNFASYDLNNNFVQNWQATFSTAVIYSPFAVSSSLNALAVVDNNGLLFVYNKSTGRYITSSQVGQISLPNLNIAVDYYGKTIFIPVTSSRKITAYSLDFAVNQRSK